MTGRGVPIYRVTVIERTVKAVDYQYRGGPTRIDFRGTVLLPEARGEAIVESMAGRTEIDAKFEHVEPPTRFGHEYLTYVLWAITPEGHAKNLGEVLANGADRARLRVTTDLQAFGLIVTAEPYSAVRQPSDVVVIENQIRPDTMGKIEPVSAKFELLPRGEYTYMIPPDARSAGNNGARLSMDQYEALLEVYQAQNAVQIARAAGADRYAAGTLNKAEELLRSAQAMQARKVDRSTVVTAARQAAQTAEDARMIAVKHRQDEELARAREQAGREQDLRARAEAAVQAARTEASADREQLDEERTARMRAEQGPAMSGAPPALPPQTAEAPQRAARADSQERADLRVRLLQDLNQTLQARDTPRGLAVTLPDSDFQGTALLPAVYGSLSRVASVVAAHPGLLVEVDGHTDSGGAGHDERFSYERAAAVRDVLIRGGVPANSVTARGLGSSRPLVSGASASGREQNRRVEITISGEPIGSLPYWDKTYPLMPQQ